MPLCIYAEKPDVARKVSSAILDPGTKKREENGCIKITWKGEPVIVTWGYGHLCELKQAKDYDPEYANWSKLPLPFFPEKYLVKVREDAKDQFNIVRKLLNDCDEIISATDDDREGELIFAYVGDAAGIEGKPFKRVHLASQTKEGFIEAFDNLLSSEDPEVKNRTLAGRARSIADWMVGSNLTVAMTLNCDYDGIISLGRVQTPTLNMLVDRELAIRNFKPEPYYVVNGAFSKDGGDPFTATHTTKQFKDRKEAEAVLAKVQGKQGTVEKLEKKEVAASAPLLHSLSSLQMEANSKYGFTLADTLALAQKLYEAGYTTYPRTDSQYLTDDMEPVINKVLDALETTDQYKDMIQGMGRQVTHKKNYFNSGKVSSHYAIIPTGQIPSSLGEREMKIYDLIARSVIMMIYPDAIAEKTSLLMDVDGEKFSAKGQIIKKKGWMEVSGTKSKENIIPPLSEGDTCDGEYSIEDKVTKPPKRYTDNSLAEAMISAGSTLEDKDLKALLTGIHGIGTPATRANIVETLITRGYAKREKKNIVATDFGIKVIEAIPIEDIKSPALTAKWEQRLNNIEAGTEDYDTFLEDMKATTSQWCTAIQSHIQGVHFSSGPTFTCPFCNRQMRKMKWGWGCTGYKNGCDFAVPEEIAGKKLPASAIKELIENGITKKISGFKSKSGKAFEAMLELDRETKKVNFKFEEKPKAQFEESAYSCPLCGKTLRKYDWGLSCPGFKDGCNFSLSFTIAKKKITDDIIEQILENGATGPIDGFVSKKGKTFSACLVLDHDSGKVNFQFDD